MDKKEYFKEYRKNNREKLNEYHKEYRRKQRKEEPEKIKKYRLDYYQKNKDILLARNKKWREENPEKIKKLLKDYYCNNKYKCSLRAKTRDAVKKGLIKKEPCNICNSKKSEIHHNDYDNYLDITWLCRNCHAILHKELRDKYS